MGKRKYLFLKEEAQPFIAFLLAAITVLVSFALAEILPGQRYMELEDAYTQPAAFARLLTRHLFDGSGMFYSPELSLGQNTSLVYAMYGYSPFSLLYFLPFDSYTVLMFANILRVAFAAAFFELFLRKGMGIRGRASVGFSLCYALCSFHIYFLNSANFAEGVYLFPLLMWLLMRYIREKKGFALCLGYLLCFVSNFYAGYVIGLASFSALLLFLFLRDGKAFIKINLGLLLRYVFIVLSALAMSMLVLCPAFAFYLSVMQGEFNGDFDSITSPLKLLSGMFWGEHNKLMDDYTAFYAGIPVILLFAIYFFNRRFSKKERILVFLAALSFIPIYYIKPLYLALHAFNYPTGFPIRFGYVFVFLIVLVAARQFTRFEASILMQKGGQFYFLGGFCVTALLSLLFGRTTAWYVLIINLVLIILWVVYFAVLRSRLSGRIACFTGAALIILEMSSSIFIGYPDDYSGEDYRFYTRQVPAVADRIREEQKDGQLYRARISNALSYNLPSEYGFHGSGAFTTAVYPGLQLFMLRMGDNITGYTYTMEGMTDLTEMLLGIRYQARLASRESAFGNDLFYYETNDHALPVGFMASEDLFGLSPLGINPFDNQNAILSAMLGHREQAYISAGEPLVGCQDMQAFFREDGSIIMQRDSDAAPGVASLSIPRKDYEHAYFMLSNLTENPTERRFEEDEGLLTIYSERDRRTDGVRGPDCLNPGKGLIEMDVEDDLFYILLTNEKYPETKTVFNHVYCYYQDDTVLEQSYGELSANGWRINASSSVKIDATVTATADKPLLFLSIPYDSGWECLVDGKETAIEAVIDGAFMAIGLTPGEHQISLNYRVPGLTAGTILFVVGVMGLVGIAFLEKKEYQSERAQKKLERRS